MLFPYISNENCTVARGLFHIDTKKGGTNRFGVHMRVYDELRFPTEQVQDLDRKCRDEISKAGALAVTLDFRPMRFAEQHEVIALFAELIFKAGQTVPFDASINRNSYSPTKTAINASLEQLVHDWRTSFRKYLNDELISSGGAVTIDAVTLKVQGRQFLDFTVHHMHMTKPKSILEKPKFSIISSTVSFTEGPDVSSGATKRVLFDENLRSSYGVDFNSF